MENEEDPQKTTQTELSPRPRSNSRKDTRYQLSVNTAKTNSSKSLTAGASPSPRINVTPWEFHGNSERKNIAPWEYQVKTPTSETNSSTLSQSSNLSIISPIAPPNSPGLQSRLFRRSTTNGIDPAVSKPPATEKLLSSSWSAHGQARTQTVNVKMKRDKAPSPLSAKNPANDAVPSSPSNNSFGLEKFLRRASTAKSSSKVNPLPDDPTKIGRSLESKCIRVYDTHDQSFLIDVSIATDAVELRNIIFRKMRVPEEVDHELYVRSKSFDRKLRIFWFNLVVIRDTSIDDLTLAEICTNSDHPYRLHLECDVKRHPQVSAQITSNLKRNKFPLLNIHRRALGSSSSDSDNEGDDIDSDDSDDGQDKMQKRDERERQKMAKLIGFFGESINPALAPKLEAFFGETAFVKDKEAPSLRKRGKSILRESSTVRRKNSLSKTEDIPNARRKNSLPKPEDAPNGRRKNSLSKQIFRAKSKADKLANFFGDRPTEEQIANNFEKFFPDLIGKEIQDHFTEHVESSKTKAQELFQMQIMHQRETKQKLKYLLGESRTERVPLKDDQDLDIRQDLAGDGDTKFPASVKKFSKGSNGEYNDYMDATIDSSIDSLEVPPPRPLKKLELKKETSTTSIRSQGSLSTSKESYGIEYSAVPIQWVKGPLIGQGAFGKVYYGANVKTGQIMAIKQVEISSKHLASGAAQKELEALRREILILKELNHPNIVRYFGCCNEKNVINVFLQYVSGGSVTSALALMGPFDEILVKSLMNQILDGLEYLHNQFIIHRDIKGANILIDENGWAHISDFAKEGPYEMSSTMSIQGTVYWMAPEILKGKECSAKVDIWSLGCVVLEMLTCVHPWGNLDEVQTLWRLGRKSTPPLPDNLSQQALDFLEQTFRVNPVERPTAKDLMLHEFCVYDVENFDFRAYKEQAIAKKIKEDMSSDECESGDSFAEGLSLSGQSNSVAHSPFLSPQSSFYEPPPIPPSIENSLSPHWESKSRRVSWRIDPTKNELPSLPASPRSENNSNEFLSLGNLE